MSSRDRLPNAGEAAALARKLLNGRSSAWLSRKQIAWLRDVADREQAAQGAAGIVSPDGTVFHEDRGLILKDETASDAVSVRLERNGAGFARDLEASA